MRGELKTHVRPLVTSHYNLVASVNIRDSARTAELVLRILENNGLVYKVRLPHFSVKHVK